MQERQPSLKVEGLRSAGAQPALKRRTMLRKVAATGAAFAAGFQAAFAGEQQKKSAGTRKAPYCVERTPGGCEIWQVTTKRYAHSNIYCEVPYCSRDSRYFVYARRNPDGSRNPYQFVVVEFGTWREEILDRSVGIAGCAISPKGVFYYLKRLSHSELGLLRVDLCEGTPQVVYRRKAESWIFSLGTVTSDGRYYAGGVRTDPHWKEFGVVLVDLAKGTETVIDRDPYILNPHPQFEPGKGGYLLIQHNRGGLYSPDGKLKRLVGPEGATLYLLSIPGGKRTELPIGKPYTTAVTGHEAWIGNTQEVLFSVAARGAYAPEKGNLLAVTPKGRVRRVARGFRFNHVGVSRCGRFFSCDDWQGKYALVLGSTKTGACRVLCYSRTTPTRSQRTHPHAYLSPDLKWVVFNSNRSGFPHIHAARVPEGFLKNLS